MTIPSGNDEAELTASSGNVFADLEIPEPEEALAKAELARQIGLIIRERRLTQRKAAKLLGIDQPKVSALLSGRLAGFSMERLLRFLVALDRDVEITVRARPAERATARLHVVSR